MKLKIYVALAAACMALSLADVKAQTVKKTQSASLPASSLKAAEEMLIASGGKDQFEKNIEASMSQMATSLPEDKREKFVTVMRAFIAKYVSWEVLKPEMCQLYAHEFTEAELKQLTAFYKTPLGQKLQQKTPIIMQTSMSLGQKAAAEHQTELQQMMMEAMK